MTLKNILLLIICVPIVSCGIMPWTWDGKEWNNNMRELTMATAKSIPEIGSVVSSIIGIFWPEDKDSIWDTLATEMEALISKKILENNLQSLNADLDSIADDMAEYHNSVNLSTSYSNVHDYILKSEASEWLTQALSTCNDVKNHVLHAVADDEYIHLFPIMIPLSILHLINLRERYIFGEQIYGKPHESWKTELNDTYYEYKNWFDKNYNLWHTWRSSRISGKCIKNNPSMFKNPCTRWQVYDKTSGQKIKHDIYSEDAHATRTTWQAGTKWVLINEASEYMIRLLLPTFYLHQYVPWMANDTTAIITSGIPSSLYLGPYAAVKNKPGELAGYGRLNDDMFDEPGIITAVKGNKIGPNRVSNLQLIYTTHDGKAAHSKPDGGAFTYFVDSKNSWITSFRVKWGLGPNDGPICEFGIGYNNFTKNPKTTSVDKHHWPGPQVNVTMGDEYKLTSIAYIQIPSAQFYQGIPSIAFQFTHKSAI